MHINSDLLDFRTLGLSQFPVTSSVIYKSIQNEKLHEQLIDVQWVQTAERLNNNASMQQDTVTL